MSSTDSQSPKWTEEDTFRLLRRWDFRSAQNLVCDSDRCPRTWTEFEDITGWTEEEFNAAWDEDDQIRMLNYVRR